MNNAELDNKLSKDMRMIKSAVWVYFFLLIFEGGLRKWLLPGLATPLLIIRDPIALWIMVTAYKHHLFPSSHYIKGMFLVTVISVLLALSIGHGNLSVAFFGARIFLIHFPLMFVIGRIFEQEDVIKMGKMVLLISIPMVLLIGMQFYSPQSALVNRGVGNDMAGAGFSGSGDYLRPSGTFSFTTGNVAFFQLVMVFVVYFLVNAKKINRIILYGASAALILAIPLSISRTLFFSLGLVLLFLVFAIARKKKYISKIFSLIGVTLVSVIILSQTPVFKTSIGAFMDRFETANEMEGGVESVLIDRVLGGMVGALTDAFDNESLLGKGIGMGTNVGAKLLTGKMVFLISEGEWGRLIGEMGPLLGLIVIYIRVHFGLRIFKVSYIKMKHGDFLSWMLLSIGLKSIIMGQWASPTELGFSTLFGGLIIASFRNSEFNK